MWQLSAFDQAVGQGHIQHSILFIEHLQYTASLLGWVESYEEKDMVPALEGVKCWFWVISGAFHLVLLTSSLSEAFRINSKRPKVYLECKWVWALEILGMSWSQDAKCPTCTRLSLSHVRLFVTPWTIACQAPLSMEFFQARIVKWVAMPTFRGSSQPRDRTWVSCGATRNIPQTQANSSHSACTCSHILLVLLRDTLLWWAKLATGCHNCPRDSQTHSGGKVWKVRQQLLVAPTLAHVATWVSPESAGCCCRNHADVASARALPEWLHNCSQNLRGSLCNKRRGSKFWMPPWV